MEENSEIGPHLLEFVIESEEIDLEEMIGLYVDACNRDNTDMYTFDTDSISDENKYLEHDHNYFSAASITRLVHIMEISSMTKKSIPIIQYIIRNEIHKILTHAIIFRDQRNAKILQDSDIIEALTFIKTPINIIPNIFKKLKSKST
jgi:hypothetical protein